jgi:hypothetical protein
MTFHSSEGHAASDHFFADVDGDGSPDIAVGRLPVTSPDDIAAITSKSIAYASQPPPGPWRRNILWITNDQRAMQMRTERLRAMTADLGFSDTAVYPQPEEANNQQNQRRLIEAFDEGQLLVHFLGHGGRHIWRTGPPDFKKNHDLFTMGDLDALEPNGRLPIVLSMTCFTAPFDHPSADSIGEKFLRLPGRGAAAVIAASWRNDPSESLSAALIESLTRPTTVGEGFMEAKRRQRDEVARGGGDLENLYTYNLLGDPALPVPVARERLRLERDGGAPGTLRIAGSFESEPISGRLLLEWLDENEAVVHAEQRKENGARFTATAPPGAAGRIHAVRAYVWNPASGEDAMGYLRFDAPADKDKDAA